ncbi:SynChlorMet cassette protein ScmC [Candidatus Poribacteria bacterium]
MNIDLAGQYLSGYRLSLSDGSNWWIAGYEDTVPWVDELAAIMELEECKSNGSPRLIFSKLADESDVEDGAKDAGHRVWGRHDLNDAGWVCYDDRLIRIWQHDSISDVILEVRHNLNDTVKYVTMWTSLYPIYKRSMSGGGLPLHAGSAELDGQGILVAASGDTGKSTCCRRLPDYWNPLADDEALVVLDTQKKHWLHPFPTWSDYLWERAENTWNVQYSVSLSGIFFLEQSETDEVVPLGTGEAAVLISESATQVCQKFWRRADIEDQRRFRSDIFSNACEMAKRVPVYRLRASLHGRFWEEIENVLT